MGPGLGTLCDQFRNGRDARDLIPMLDSEDVDQVCEAVWILNEISFKSFESAAFIDRLARLAGHEDEDVRFWALGALYEAFIRDRELAERLLRKAADDPSEAVRSRASAAADRLQLNLAN